MARKRQFSQKIVQLYDILLRVHVAAEAIDFSAPLQ